MGHALDEQALMPFLQRKRRGAASTKHVALGPFLAETMELARKLISVDLAVLHLDDPSRPRARRELRVVAASGKGADALVGTALSDRRNAILSTYRDGTRRNHNALPGHRLPWLRESSTAHGLSEPVRLERAVCGVFTLVRRTTARRRTFTPRERDLAQLMAQYCSRAILNAIDVVKQNDLALSDDLTGLRNARGLHEFLDRTIRHAHRADQEVVVMFVDVDHLKNINDRHGHRAGSEALKRTAKALKSAVKDRGTVFRFGGDEFVVICPDLGLRDTVSLTYRMEQVVRRMTPGPLPHGGKLPRVTISIGFATLSASLDHRSDVDEDKLPRAGARLLYAADRALFRAKRRGRAQSVQADRSDDRLGRA